MPEEGEVAIPLNNDVVPEGTIISYSENELGGEDVSGKIAEFTKNIDALRFGITKKVGGENEIEEAQMYVETHIDDMLSLCLGPDESSSQALRNVYLTLLCSHLTENEPLRLRVGEYFLSDSKRVESLVTNTVSENSLHVFASLYHGAKDVEKDELEEVLAQNINVFDPYLEKGDLRFALTFLDSLSGRTSSPRAQQFRTYLEDKMDIITRHLSAEDLSQSEQIFDLAKKLYGAEEGKIHRYLDLLGSSTEILLKGFSEGKFSDELKALLHGKVDGSLKGRIVDSLAHAFETGGEEMKREVYEMLSVTLVSGGVPEVSDSIVAFLNSHSDAIIEDIFHHGGKIYYLDTLLQVCSDEVVEKVFHELDSTLEISKDAGANAYLFNILNVSIGQRRGSIRRAIPLYEKYMQKLQDVMYDPFLLEQLKGWKADVYKDAVSKAALYGSDEVVEQAVEMVCHTLQFDPQQFFSQYGVEHEKFVDAWRQGMGDVFENFSHNKFAVEKLAKERGADIIKALSEEFGIRNFSRYPIELLVRQYDERNVNDKKFGVLLFSTFDHGKAFNSEEDRQIMMSMRDQIGDNMLMRFAEAGSRFELIKRLSQLYQRYGQMSFGLVGAHGADNLFQLGFGGERKELSVEDLLIPGVEKTGRFFEEGAPLILESCSTGADAGIAEKISESLGMKVIAPKEDSGGIQEIKVTVRQDAPPDFDVNFWYTKGRQFQKGSLVSESSAIEDED